MATWLGRGARGTLRGSPGCIQASLPNFVRLFSQSLPMWILVSTWVANSEHLLFASHTLR